MTSQSYYKDRLGFDPNEVQYESSTQSRRSSGHRHISSSSRGGHHQQHTSHHTHHHTQQHRSQQQQHHQQQHQASASASPVRISISPGGASLDQYAGDTSPPKKPKHMSTLQQPQGGYEDALTQFKGTMSIWEYFIENWDIIRKSV